MIDVEHTMKLLGAAVKLIALKMETAVKMMLVMSVVYVQAWLVVKLAVAGTSTATTVHVHLIVLNLGIAVVMPVRSVVKMMFGIDWFLPLQLEGMKTFFLLLYSFVRFATMRHALDCVMATTKTFSAHAWHLV
jgi:hypothetical protein